MIERLPVPLRRVGYRAAWWGLAAWWLVRRPHTQGVKFVLRDGDDVLFVRHTYGNDRDTWTLPGGSLKRGEAPLVAARREAHEELGLDLDAWEPFGTYELVGHKTTTLHCFSADCAGAQVTIDPGELEEARWASSADPPRPLGRDSERILRVLVEHLDADG